MENWFKTNGIVLAVYLITGSIAYGSLEAAVSTLKKTAEDRAGYVPQFIAMQSEVMHLREESIRTRNVWVKLDNTLDTLNGTMLLQGSEITALKEDVKEIKKAVVK